MRKSTHPSGQILISGLGLSIVLIILFLYYAAWAVRNLNQMRMDTAADAAALSAARSQAEQLNNIATLNILGNAFIKKVRVPLLGEVGGMSVDDIPGYEAWNDLLQLSAFGFKTVPAGVGMTVAKLNGADNGTFYFPLPMPHYLIPISMPVVIYSIHPPDLWIEDFDHVYFARGWKQNFQKAQPIHKTTWVVSHNGIRSVASARLWLDLPTGSLLNNGGFPRQNETWLGDIFIQDWLPQFNARLLAKPVIGLQQLLNLRGRG